MEKLTFILSSHVNELFYHLKHALFAPILKETSTNFLMIFRKVI